MVLTVAFHPVYDWLSVRLGNRPKLAAAIITLVSLAIIIGPVTWLGFGVADGPAQLLRAILGAATVTIPSPPEGVKDWPIVGAQAYRLWNEASTNLSAALREVAPHLKPLAGSVLAFAGSAGFGTLKFVAALAISGFLLHFGPRLVAGIRRIQARLVTQRSQDFVALAGLTIRTVAQGVIGVAVLQSLLAGIGLKVAGVPHAGVLALAVLGSLQSLQIGSAVILLPVIIWIWATKDFAVALGVNDLSVDRGACRQRSETDAHGARAEHADACDLHRCSRRRAGAWNPRPVYWTYRPGGNMGIDYGVDTRRAGGTYFSRCRTGNTNIGDQNLTLRRGAADHHSRRRRVHASTTGRNRLPTDACSIDLCQRPCWTDRNADAKTVQD